MSMSKKDYQLIADAIHRSKMAHGIGVKNAKQVLGVDRALRLVATDIAATLAHSNPNFDKAKFLAACGL